MAKSLGPLHGIVMTLKNQFNVKDYNTTLGYTCRAYKPAEDNVLLVQILSDMDVVFIAKTHLRKASW